MNNYEYIIASLPLIKLDERAGGSVDASCVIEEIRSQLSDRDDRMMELLLESYNPDKLDASLYRRAFKSPSSFLRSHFLFDLQLRNTRVEYLNAALGRPEGKDTLILEELEDRDFEQKEEVEAVCWMDYEETLAEIRQEHEAGIWGKYCIFPEEFEQLGVWVREHENWESLRNGT